jgi:hypothetical protein
MMRVLSFIIVFSVKAIAGIGLLLRSHILSRNTALVSLAVLVHNCLVIALIL